MYKYLEKSDLTRKLFLIGIFFLASAPIISIFFLILSSIISFKNNLKQITNDKWNLIFIFSVFSMPLISLLQSSELANISNNWEKSLAWFN